MNIEVTTKARGRWRARTRAMATAADEPQLEQPNDDLPNYVDFDAGSKLLVSMEPFVVDVSSACAELERRFGFQHSSVQNQRENVIMLLSNIYSHTSAKSTDEQRAAKSQKSKALIELHER